MIQKILNKSVGEYKMFFDVALIGAGRDMNQWGQDRSVQEEMVDSVKSFWEFWYGTNKKTHRALLWNELKELSLVEWSWNDMLLKEKQ